MSGRRAVATTCAVKAAVTLAFAGRYGWHRDELYYRAAGQHLALGYVDFPPITPSLARLAHVLFGDTLVGLRLFAVLAGVATILLTASMARALWQSDHAVAVAAVGAAAFPFLLGANGLFQTVSFDVLAWALALWAIVRLLTSDNPRWWVAVGAAIGLSFEVKYTTPALVAGLGVATLASPVLRRHLRTRWPWLGALVALVLAAPNVAWQIDHGWPSVQFLRDQNERVRVENPTSSYLFEQVFLLGPPLVVVSLAGIRRLWREERLRPLVYVVLTVELFYLVARAKSYYPMDVASLVLAAGAGAVADGWSRRDRRTVVGATVAFAVVLLPIGVPVLPVSTMLRLGIVDVRDDFSAELGWPRVVDVLALAARDVPPQERRSLHVLSRSYAVAGAVDLYGPGRGIPGPAWSGHNTYWFWLPRSGDVGTVLAVGFPEPELRRWFADVRPAGRFPDDERIDVEQRGMPIFLARSPRVDMATLRRRVKVFG